ncbi:MAG: insulinase family protein [Crocinitomicaceae bacterium]|nr:insulinase family protein [Crocinitomicaceae bacterium]
MKNLIITGLLASISFAGLSQREIEYVEYDLDNGIHVILHEETSTPIVAVSVLYHVGSKNEKDERTGFAHFFEHLLFEGSENIDRGEYSELVEKNGGTLNANTSWDRTFYYEILPSNQLELGLWLESERLLHAKVDNTGIETQRSVVKEEKRQRDQPYSSFIEEMFSRMYPDHPYRWMPIGSMEHLDAAEKKDYVHFYRTFYVPANATLTIAGDIDIDETKKWINKYFNSVPKGQALNLYRDLETMDEDAFKKAYYVSKDKFNINDFFNPEGKEAKSLLTKLSNTPIVIPRPTEPKEKLTEVKKAIVHDNIQLPALFMGYQIPNQTHEDMYALQMMNDVLSGGTSSRINKSLVEQKQMAVQAFSAAFGLEQAGVAIFGAIGAAGQELDAIQAEIDVQIKLIQDELISQEEFEKVKNQYENRFVSSNSTIAGIAENLADNHVYNGGAEKINTELANFLSVTREDIQRVAKKYLTKDARIVLHYLPMEKGAEESENEEK